MTYKFLKEIRSTKTIPTLAAAWDVLSRINDYQISLKTDVVDAVKTILGFYPHIIPPVVTIGAEAAATAALAYIGTKILERKLGE
jgi:hypothetical protein